MAPPSHSIFNDENRGLGSCAGHIHYLKTPSPPSLPVHHKHTYNSPLQVPKGPQLKIQRACREAGLASYDDPPAVRTASAGSTAGSTSQGTLSSNGGKDAKGSKTASASTGAPVKDESNECYICFERPIEVRGERADLLPLFKEGTAEAGMGFSLCIMT